MSEIRIDHVLCDGGDISISIEGDSFIIDDIIGMEVHYKDNHDRHCRMLIEKDAFHQD